MTDIEIIRELAGEGGLALLVGYTIMRLTKIETLMKELIAHARNQDPEDTDV